MALVGTAINHGTRRLCMRSGFSEYIHVRVPNACPKVASSSASKACAQYVANVSGSAGDQALQEHTDSPSYLVRVVENVSSSSRNHYSLGNAVAYPSNHHHAENAT